MRLFHSLPALLSLRGLRARLVLLVILALAPVALLHLHNIEERQRDRIAAAQREALLLARSAAGEQEALIQKARNLLEALAELPAIRSGDRQACHAVLRPVVERNGWMTALWVSDRDGESLCNHLGIAPGVNNRDRQFFQEAVSTGMFTLSGYLIGRATGRPVMIAALPIPDEQGQVRRLINVSLDIGWINDYAAKAARAAAARLVIVDGEGGSSPISLIPAAGSGSPPSAIRSSPRC